MFGIGAGEFVVIAVILLIAVGPDKMPGFFRTVGKSLRAFRRTTRELKSAVGFEELFRDEDLQPHNLHRAPRAGSSRRTGVEPAGAVPRTDRRLDSEDEGVHEQPLDDVDRSAGDAQAEASGPSQADASAQDKSTGGSSTS